MEKPASEDQVLREKKKRTNVVFGNLQPNTIVRKFQIPNALRDMEGTLMEGALTEGAPTEGAPTEGAPMEGAPKEGH